MTNVRAQRFKSVLRQVNDVLLKEWAPLGVVEGVLLDEYESYAMQVISLLASGASDNDIAAYLAGAEESVRGKAMNVESLRPVAKRLMQFREAARAVAL